MGWEGPEQGWRKGPWTPEEDKLLLQHVNHHGDCKWSSVATTTGLKRSGKSCRLRWVNYLRHGLKKGQITSYEEAIIVELHSLWGNKWSTIARHLPGRTDNEIKNYWRTHFKKKKDGASSKRKREEYQILKQEENDDDTNDHIQGMREETNNMGCCISNYYNYNWGLMEDHIDQWSPEMVMDSSPEEVVSELWSGLWNLDDPHFTHFSGNTNTIN